MVNTKISKMIAYSLVIKLTYNMINEKQFL